jgi:hypothetical protein
MECLKNGEVRYQNISYPVPKMSLQMKHELLKAHETKNYWPKIDYISCWVDGSAAYFLDELKERFPNAIIMGKGLLATEAPLTFPSEKAKGYLPLVNNVFYEFIDKENEVYQLHELELNEEYEVLITTRAGLLRYKMNDIVQVTGYYKNTPCLKFLRRAGKVSDLTGEKLSEADIEQALSGLLAKYEKAYLKPHIGKENYYEVFYDGKNNQFAQELEASLQSHYHYSQSRKLNQLKELRLIQVENTQKHYNQYLEARGMKLGDIKFSVLLLN